MGAIFAVLLGTFSMFIVNGPGVNYFPATAEYAFIVHSRVADSGVLNRGKACGTILACGFLAYMVFRMQHAGIKETD